MSDAAAAARARIDRALSALERKIEELKTRAPISGPVEDDDLFAIPTSSAVPEDPVLRRRIQELEAAGREASEALAGAIEQLRGLAELPGRSDPEMDEGEG